MRFASSELQKTIELRASIGLQKPIESIELYINCIGKTEASPGQNLKPDLGAKAEMKGPDSPHKSTSLPIIRNRS